MKTMKQFFFNMSFLFSCIFFMHSLAATTTTSVFAKYPNKYFIETGSYYGDGIQMALEAGFPEVISIEISPLYYFKVANRFAKYPNVKLLLGNSPVIIQNLLNEIDAPATFWLDGHYSGGNTGKSSINCPLLEELESIGKHHIKTHTILIDDVRLFGSEEWEFVQLSDAIKKIFEINPNYKIRFEDGYIAKDVLVAYIP